MSITFEELQKEKENNNFITFEEFKKNKKDIEKFVPIPEPSTGTEITEDITGKKVAAPMPGEKQDISTVEQVSRTFAGAGRDLIQGTADFANFLLPGDPINLELPEVPEPTYFGGSLTRDITGFLLPFGALGKAGRIAGIPQATTKIGKITNAITKGGLAEQFAFSPYEKRLSNLVQQYPSLKNPVTEYLQATDEDSELKARAKMFAEGALLGIPLELISNALKGKANKNIKPSKSTPEILKVAKKNEAENISPSVINRQKEQIESIAEIGKPKKDINEILGRKPRTLQGVDVPSDIIKPSLKFDVKQPVLNAAEDLLVSGKVARNPNLQINEQIADLLVSGRLADDEIKKIFTKNKITSEDFAKFFGGDASDAGRTLQSLAVIQKKINKLKGVDNEFDDLVKASGSDDLTGVGGFFKRLDNVRRGLMVTQIATAVRNFESQVARVGISVMQNGIDNALQSLYRVITKKPVSKGMKNPLPTFSGFLDIFRQFRPSKFKEVKSNVNEILKFYPREEDRLFLRYSSDVQNTDLLPSKGIIKKPIEGLEKSTNLLNIFNKTQEFITRRAVFQSTLDEIIKNNKDIYSGRDLVKILQDGDSSLIRKQDIALAVDQALEVTFAKNFTKGKGAYESFAKTFIDFVNKIPFTLSLALPFPRFLMNSLKFHFEFSPVGILRYLSKDEIAKLAKGDTSGLTKAVIGSSMLLGAYSLRHQPYAGEKWYEFKIGKRTIDTRPLNPFAAYLFVADTIKRSQEGTLRDLDLKGIASVFAGTRAGTGLFLVDKFIERISGVRASGDNLETIAKEIIGNTIGGFLVPLQTATDLLSEIYPEMAFVRDARGKPVKGQLEKRFPLNTDLPPLYHATKIVTNPDGTISAAPIKRESPGLRQVTGISFITEKNEAEKEMDRLGFLNQEIFKSTGIAELDKAIKDVFAPQIAIGLSEIVKSEEYKNQSNSVKSLIIKEVLKEARANAKKEVQKRADLVPYILKYEIEKIPNDQRKVLDEYLGKDYLDTLIKEYIKKNDRN